MGKLITLIVSKHTKQPNDTIYTKKDINEKESQEYFNYLKDVPLNFRIKNSPIVLSRSKVKLLKIKLVNSKVLMDLLKK